MDKKLLHIDKLHVSWCTFWWNFKGLSFTPRKKRVNVLIIFQTALENDLIPFINGELYSLYQVDCSLIRLFSKFYMWEINQILYSGLKIQRKGNYNWLLKDI